MEEFDNQMNPIGNQSPREFKHRASRRPHRTVSSCATKMHQRSFSNYWAIENFKVQLELHNSGEFMLAPKFGDAEYEFAMKLFPNGKDEETNGFLSLFLLINKCPNPRLRFRVSFTVETADGPRSCHLNKNLVTINRSGIVTASKFFGLDIIRSAPSVYIPNDILTIGCELTVFGEPQTCPTTMFAPYPRTGNSSLNSSLSAVKVESDDGLTDLLITGDFSDFTVVASCGREFRTHMCVLSAKSEYFRALLRNQSTLEYTSKRVKFEDISGSSMAILLRHIYSSGSERTLVDDSLLSTELITAVDRLMVTTMRTEIAQVLEVLITPDNVTTRLCWAAELRLDDTYNLLTEFFAANKKDCISTDTWNAVRSEKPSLAIKILEDAILNHDDSTSSVDRRIVDRIVFH